MKFAGTSSTAADLPAQSTGAAILVRMAVRTNTVFMPVLTASGVATRVHKRLAARTAGTGAAAEYRPGQDAREDQVASTAARIRRPTAPVATGWVGSSPGSVRRGLHAGHERDDELLPE